MNGRIQELSKQAYELQRHKHGGYFTQQLLLDAFAELIVKECLHIVDDEGAGEGGCIRAMIRIQEEFGVEE